MPPMYDGPCQRPPAGVASISLRLSVMLKQIARVSFLAMLFFVLLVPPSEGRGGGGGGGGAGGGGWRAGRRWLGRRSGGRLGLARRISPSRSSSRPWCRRVRPWRGCRSMVGVGLAWLGLGASLLVRSRPVLSPSRRAAAGLYPGSGSDDAGSV